MKPNKSPEILDQPDLFVVLNLPFDIQRTVGYRRRLYDECSGTHGIGGLPNGVETDRRLEQIVNAQERTAAAVERIAEQCVITAPASPSQGEALPKQDRSVGSPLLDLREAAAHLGISVKKLRKIVERSRKRAEGISVRGETIQFHQDGPGSQIRFKREWLDEYLTATTLDPTTSKTKVQVTREKQRGKHDPELAEGEHINFDYLD